MAGFALEGSSRCVEERGGESRGRLPEVIDKFLETSGCGRLDRVIFNQLDEFDATRHLLVHRFGVVNDTYRDRVKDNRFHRGEQRPLSGEILTRYAELAQAVAVLFDEALRPRA
jgi:hypothetical protein